MTADVSSIRPYQVILPEKKKKSLHGDLNSEEVTTSCHIERVLIDPEKYLEKEKKRKVGVGACL